MGTSSPSGLVAPQSGATSPGAGRSTQSADSARGGNPSCGSAPDSLAAARGENWALADKPAAATGITRPILAECHPDRIILRADRRSGFASQVIPFEDASVNTIDHLVAGIQQHVRRWGMAVARGYWKPVLRCEVFPGAEGRFWEVKTLLEGSGIVVEQR
jgi:hypothetical protein